MIFCWSLSLPLTLSLPLSASRTTRSWSCCGWCTTAGFSRRSGRRCGPSSWGTTSSACPRRTWARWDQHDAAVPSVQRPYCEPMGQVRPTRSTSTMGSQAILFHNCNCMDSLVVIVKLCLLTSHIAICEWTVCGYSFQFVSIFINYFFPVLSAVRSKLSAWEQQSTILSSYLMCQIFL